MMNGRGDRFDGATVEFAMSMRLMLATALMFTGGVACSSDGEPRSPSETQGQSTSPMGHFPVGATGDFTLYAHCGVQFVTIDGATWRTRLRDDGNGNPPPWPTDAFQGTITRPRSDRVVYASPSLPMEKLVFRPAPHAHYTCA
jgi:hypothetical protein